MLTCYYHKRLKNYKVIRINLTIAEFLIICIMLKSSHHNKILTTLSTTLPDDRPITSIQIVEYIDKCPKGFVSISRTHDQDQDADLWREPSFLKRKSGRYLCLSKSEGIPNFIVQEIRVVNEKGVPPEGFSLLNRTADTDQKAWRKKQLCYRLVKYSYGIEAITDIIVCSRLKKAPEGFNLAGEINGMTVCFKMGNVQDTANGNGNDTNGQSKNSDATFPHARAPPERPPRPAPSVPGVPSTGISPYPRLSDGGDNDYEILLPDYKPIRPAPHPPAPNRQYSTSTLQVFHGLEGVPFVLNPKFTPGGSREMNQLPVIKRRTLQQLMKDYSYDFSVERQS